MDSEKLKEILLQGDYVTKEDIEKAVAYAKAHRTNFVDYLIDSELINKDLLGQAVAESIGLIYADLNTHQPSKEQVLKIPEEIARKFRVVLFKEDEEFAVAASDNPLDEKMVANLDKLFEPKKVVFAYCMPEDLDSIFFHYRKTLDTRFAKIIQEQGKVATEIIEEIFQDAFMHQASDIHFEPQEGEVLVRFRVDGVLHEAGRIPKEYYENILNRIKVQGHMRIDEHYSAQDGAIRYMRNNKPIDLRVSIIPSLDGEKITIRVLGEYVRSFNLSDLGLNDYEEDILETSVKKPFGMILVTGPTGSGKTTTLYSLLKLLNHPEVNVTTIEDPVEYKISGINQIQVNNQTNLTFSEGLRSIVRQDPDIILVGEIRDRETAEIAVNAALTGHLLLSTFHANDAATALPRLLDMGVEPFLLASTLEVIIAQRLVRRICENCRTSHNAKLTELQKIFPEIKQYLPSKGLTLYRGKGCSVCNKTGFKGRTAIFEFIEITPKMKELVLKNPSTQEIWDLASKQGSISLFKNGIDKVKNGITTLDELMRVAAPKQ